LVEEDLTFKLIPKTKKVEEQTLKKKKKKLGPSNADSTTPELQSRGD